MNPLGDKIRSLRERRNLTQEQLAEIVGVHQSKISHCETGERGVSLSLLERLARALDVDRNDLIDVAIESNSDERAIARA